MTPSTMAFAHLERCPRRTRTALPAPSHPRCCHLKSDSAIHNGSRTSRTVPSTGYSLALTLRHPRCLHPERVGVCRTVANRERTAQMTRAHGTHNPSTLSVGCAAGLRRQVSIGLQLVGSEPVPTASRLNRTHSLKPPEQEVPDEINFAQKHGLRCCHR
jgi:hypothetical protein